MSESMLAGRRFVFCGASSAIARSFVESAAGMGAEIIGITSGDPSALSGYDNVYRVSSYSGQELPELSGTVHGLVYFPGTIHLKPFARFSENDFIQDFRINALGAAECIKKYHANLKSSPNASVVLFSSVAATLGMAYHSSIAMAKGAVEGLTRALAAEFAPHIRVNAIAPSLTETPLGQSFINSPEKREAAEKRNPMRKVGHPQEMASAVEFLLTEKSSWITGQILSVDGGMKHLKII